MPYYKSPDNSLHFLDSADFASLLPADSVLITDAEAQAIEAANAPKPAPLTVTPYQFKAALVQQGLYAQALAAVNAGDVLTQLAWAEAQTFVENDSHIVAIAAALGKTTADIHTLFQLAGTLAP